MSEDAGDLEGRVRELEATVRGLTSELVDATERINQLEAALEGRGADAPTEAPDSRDASGETDKWVPATEELTEAASETDGGEESREGTDDIIVA
ncbi:MAG: hypothetical protein ABEJ59_01670 [Halanaeroarchaeum sp.]